MTGELKVLREQAEAELLKARAHEELLAIRTRYLGRKGLLTGLLRNIANVPPEERPQFGKRCNEFKEELEARIDQVTKGLAASNKEELLIRARIDVTLPGRGGRYGHLHPVTQVREEICGIFAGLGFTVVEGPEVELDYYNFEALNIPKDHPARDMQDTFYVDDNIVLRTHTSPVQVRIMEKNETAGEDPLTWPRLSARFGHIPYTHVSSDRGPSCGPWYQLWRSERGPDGFPQAGLRR